MDPQARQALAEPQVPSPADPQARQALAEPQVPSPADRVAWQAPAEPVVASLAWAAPASQPRKRQIHYRRSIAITFGGNGFRERQWIPWRDTH